MYSPRCQHGPPAECLLALMAQHTEDAYSSLKTVTLISHKQNVLASVVPHRQSCNSVPTFPIQKFRKALSARERGNEAHYGSMREPRQSRTTETIKEAPLTPPSLLKTKYPHRINLEFLLTFTQPIRDAYSMHSVWPSVEIFSSALFISFGEDRNQPQHFVQLN